MCINDFLRDIRHLRNPMALIKTGLIMMVFQQNESRNVKICQNIDKIFPSQLFLLNIIRFKFCLYL